MEQNTQNNSNTDKRQILESQIRECFGRVIYSHKTHEKCCDILNDRLSVIKLWQIILSAITTGGFLAAILGVGNFAIITGTVISTVLLVLNAYTKNYDLGEISQKHKQSANDLWIIRERYLSLITDLRIGEKSLKDLTEIRNQIEKDLHTAYSGAPSTNLRAYKKAQEALKNLEDMTFSDEEIDVFLPNELKKKT